MKRVLSIILAISMLLSISSVAIAATPVAEQYESTKIVNVTGKVDSINSVTLLLLDGNNNVKHIQEEKVEPDGSYRVKFKYAGSTEGLSLKVRQGKEDVTDSVIEAFTEESKAFSYTFGATTLKSNTSAFAEFENWFNVEGKTYVLMIAFYDANNKLIKVKVADEETVGFDSSSDTLTETIPEGTEKVKTFIWESVETMVPLAQEKTTAPAKSIKVLAIGNSFTDDPTNYLDDIANAEGVDLTIKRATHGGATILGHWENYDSNTPWYSSTTVNGQTVYQKTLRDYLDYELNGGIYYDIITFQQVSDDSGRIETYGFGEDPETGEYKNCAVQLAKAIREHQPTAEIVLQQTWAYENGAATKATTLNKYYEGSVDTMYEMICSTVKTACEKLAEVEGISLDGKPLRYIPTGDAFKNAKQSDIFNTTYDADKCTVVSGTSKRVHSKFVTLHRDGYHSSYLYGRYLGALVWYGALTGNSPTATKYEHSYTESNGDEDDGVYKVSDAEAQILKTAAQKAIEDYGRWN